MGKGVNLVQFQCPVFVGKAIVVVVDMGVATLGSSFSVEIMRGQGFCLVVVGPTILNDQLSFL